MADYRSTPGRLQLMQNAGRTIVFPTYIVKEADRIRIPNVADDRVRGILSDCWDALKTWQSRNTATAAEGLLADQGYDSNGMLAAASEPGMPAVMPPKSDRREQREDDQNWYQARRLVEHGFGNFRQWRGAARRQAQKAAAFRANCQIRAIAIWTKII